MRVTRDALRQVRGGHPWIYDSSVTDVRGAGAPGDDGLGDLAVVFDDKRRFAAIGLYDPTSPIRVRVLHHGGPTPIDEAFLAARLDAAVARRGELAASPGTTGYRVVHGENDGLPGVVVDRYADVVVLKLYSAAWVPHLRVLVDLMAGRLAPRTLVLRLARNVDRVASSRRIDGVPRPAEGATLLGDPPEGPVPFLEHGLAFEADVVHGQKTGWFLDQRENRLAVRGIASGRRVLDVFCAGGGFTVNAAAGGATSVHSVDRSPGAVEATRRNVAANAGRPAVAACRHEATVGDAAEVMARLAARGDRYDLVVVDPPSLAARAAQVPRALAAYGHLAELALGLLAPGGILVQASCTSRVGAEDLAEVLDAAAGRVGVPIEELARAGHAVDHPVGFPEGAYLQAITVRAGRPDRR